MWAGRVLVGRGRLWGFGRGRWAGLSHQFLGYYAAGGHPPDSTVPVQVPRNADGLTFFEAEGLDVTVRSGENLVSTDEVAQGNADIGTEWIASLVKGVEENDYNLVHLAQVFQRPGYEFVALGESNISTVDDFAGRTVGVWDFGSEFPGVVCFSQFNLTSDLDPDLPPGQTPDVQTMKYAFDPGIVFPDRSSGMSPTVDVASVMVYNELSQMVGLGYPLEELSRISSADSDCGLLEDFIFTTAAMLDDPNFRNSGVSGREVAARFVRASLQGWAWAI